MNIAVFGADGQLGTDLVAAIKRGGHQCVPLTLADADITDAARVEAILKDIRPDAVANCAALHDVAKCEGDRTLADAVNRDAVGALSRICGDLGAKFLTISSDYVFDGVRVEGYTEADEANPINYYGVSKLEGERQALANNSQAIVVRVQSLYGITGPKGKGINFVDLVLKLSQERDELKIDQCRMAPTGTAPLAANLLKLLESEQFGLFHMSCQGATTWYEFACKIVELSGAHAKVTPVPNDFFPRTFRRPENTYLVNERLGKVGLDLMPSWDDSLRQYLVMKGIAVQR